MSPRCERRPAVRLTCSTDTLKNGLYIVHTQPENTCSVCSAGALARPGGSQGIKDEGPRGLELSSEPYTLSMSSSALLESPRRTVIRMEEIDPERSSEATEPSAYHQK